jgi:hypothetical protein
LLLSPFVGRKRKSLVKHFVSPARLTDEPARNRRERRHRYSPGSTAFPKRRARPENNTAQVAAAAAPTSCAAMKPGTWLIAIPAKVVVNPRAPP